MSSSRMRIAVRTRPTGSFAQDEIFIEPPSISVHRSPSGQTVDHRADQWHFKFDSVLHNSTQDEVYESLCGEVVRDACDGRTGAVMAYGQTGSGKSCTMLGDPQSFRGRGVIPRALAQVFAHISSKPEADYAVSLSYMELYGERIRDLLVVASATGHATPGSMAAGLMAGKAGAGSTAASASLLTSPSPLALGQFEVLEDATHGTLVRGLTQVPVRTEEEALGTLFAAETARTTAEHALNARSNRAHTILTLHIQQRNRLGGGKERILSSKLHLVDLAGSERIKKTMGVAPLGDTPYAALQLESLSINKSLAVLESVVTALAARVAGRGGGHVPYRSHKLTNILKDALGGGRHACSTVIIACIWPELRHLDETLSTLRLAHRWCAVGHRMEAGGEGMGGGEGGEDAVILDAEALLQRLARENAQLRMELQMHDALADRSAPVVYGEFTPEQQARVASQLRAFVGAEGEDAEHAAVPIESVGHMRELLRQCKILIKVAGVEAEEKLRAAYTLTPKGQQQQQQHHDVPHLGGMEGGGHHGEGLAGEEGGGGGVGSLDTTGGGVGLGLAAASNRPPGGVMMGGGGSATSGSGGGGGGFPLSPTSPNSQHHHHHHQHQHHQHMGGFTPDLNAAWRQFKSTPGLGAEAGARVHAAKSALASAKATLNGLAREVNEKKGRVDACLVHLGEVKARSNARSGSPPTVGEGGGGDQHAPTPDAHAHGAKGAAAHGTAKGGAAAAHGAKGAAAAHGSGGGGGGAGSRPNTSSSPTPPEKPLVEEEFAVAAEVSGAKAEYRRLYEAWSKCRDECGARSSEVSGMVGKMLSEFETWYASNTGRLPPLMAGMPQGLYSAGGAAASPSPSYGYGGGGGGGGMGGRRGGTQAGFTSSTTPYSTYSSFGGVSGSGGGGGGGYGVGVGEDDLLDEGERFDQLEMAGVTTVEPESGTYFAASRKLRHLVSQNGNLNARPLQHSPSSPGKSGFLLSPNRR